MDKTEQILWIVLIVSLVCFFSLNSAFSQVDLTPYDKYENLKIKHSTNPNLCIFEADPTFTSNWKEIETKTKIAVYYWEASLHAVTGGNWDINILPTVPFEEHENAMAEDYPMCNIMITFEDHNPDTNALGTTGIDFASSNHKYTFIRVYLNAADLQKIEINIGELKNDEEVTITFENNRKPLPMNTVRNIIMHEIGHGLGLGHFFGVDQEKSVMRPSLEPFSDDEWNVQLVDIKMLIELYGEDGFGGNGLPYNPNACYFTQDSQLEVCD